uniref:Uncharacterized protein n=1 Tax=Anopheles culicifacies TaxID=139723 RepID=A0A182MLY8_9DIPT
MESTQRYDTAPRRYDRDRRQRDDTTPRGNGMESTQRYDTAPRRYDRDWRQRDVTTQRGNGMESMHQQGRASRNYDVAPNRYDDNHRNSQYTRPTSSEYNEIRWNPTVRRIERSSQASFRAPETVYKFKK